MLSIGSYLADFRGTAGYGGAIFSAKAKVLIYSQCQWDNKILGFAKAIDCVYLSGQICKEICQEFQDNILHIIRYVFSSLRSSWK